MTVLKLITALVSTWMLWLSCLQYLLVVGLRFTATSVFACGRRLVDSGNDRIVRRLEVNMISGCCHW